MTLFNFLSICTVKYCNQNELNIFNKLYFFILLVTKRTFCHRGQSIEEFASRLPVRNLRLRMREKKLNIAARVDGDLWSVNCAPSRDNRSPDGPRNEIKSGQWRRLKLPNPIYTRDTGQPVFVGQFQSWTRKMIYAGKFYFWTASGTHSQ